MKIKPLVFAAFVITMLSQNAIAENSAGGAQKNLKCSGNASNENNQSSQFVAFIKFSEKLIDVVDGGMQIPEGAYEFNDRESKDGKPVYTSSNGRIAVIKSTGSLSFYRARFDASHGGLSVTNASAQCSKTKSSDAFK